MPSSDLDEEQRALAEIQAALAATSVSPKRRAVEKFVLAALSSIPWVGGFISAAASLKVDQRGVEKDNLQSKWLEEHSKKMNRLSGTLGNVAERLDNLGESIDERVTSEEYLSLVRVAFRAWDRSETDQKRGFVGNLVSNAAGTRLCSDDVVRLFVDWLDTYHEIHFAVMREIYKNPGATRFEIWEALYGAPSREDSAEADLYRLLIRDLSTGGVIRQERETTGDGRFLRKRPVRNRQSSAGSGTMESAFEDSKPYVLTELGKQFVHYTMNEVVPRVGG
ncbi:MAG: hypothetical protein AB7I35_18020 [Ramlibacter sp.]